MESSTYFFSYSRQDSEIVFKLANDLKNAAVPIWLDQLHIAPGARWDDSIESALQKSDGILIVLSATSAKSQNVLDEVSYAIEQKKRIVPLMIKPCAVPFRLARFQYIDFTKDYDTAFQKLLTTLHAAPQQEVVTASQPSPAPKPHPTQYSAKKMIADTEPEKSSITTHINKIAGILLLALATAITLFSRCPSSAQYFIIYALTGLGIALLLTKSADATRLSYKGWNISVVLAGGVALPFILFFTNPIGAFKTGDCNNAPLSVTVFVHGSKGRQDMVLRQQGHVLMDLKGGERKTADINENGAAYFQNLHEGDSVRLEIDFSEPYKAIHADSVYVVTADSRIYLPVSLQGIDKIEGNVLFQDAPLPGVIVKTGSVTDTTDATGNFVLSVPEKEQKKEYKVWFIKDGFKAKSAPAFPQTGQALEVVMEKQ